MTAPVPSRYTPWGPPFVECPHVEWRAGDSYLAWNLKPDACQHPQYPQLVVDLAAREATAKGLRLVDKPHLCRFDDIGRERWIAQVKPVTVPEGTTVVFDEEPTGALYRS